MSNTYLDFLSLLPATPLQIGTVTATDGDVVTLGLPGGGVLIARGAAAVGDKVFVRDGVIEGQAPSLPFVAVEV